MSKFLQNKTAKNWIAIFLFVAVFATIIACASFYDYKVSEILTKDALKPGEYFATDFFGVFFEMVGTVPVFLLIGFCVAVVFHASRRFVKNKGLSYFLQAILFIGGVAAFWFFFKDTSKYILEHAGNAAFLGSSAGEYLDGTFIVADYRHSIPFIAVMVVFALCLNLATVFATGRFNDDTIKKLFKFTVAAAIGVIIANVVIMIVKDPIGRMRFRSINFATAGGFIEQTQGYTPWYVINGQPAQNIVDMFPADDAFKSFPSGHTCAAGMTYALILLPSLFDFKKKGANALCWIVPVLFTGIVGISRIVCGAHYMSDVTFGGSLAFVSMIIAREIVITKGANVKALFGKVVDEPAMEEEKEFAGIEV